MKILIISPFENSATGRGDRNLRLQAELLARGHEVTFVTGNFDHASKSHILREKLSDGPGHRVVRLPGYNKNVGLSRVWCHWVFAIKMWVLARRTKWDAVVVSSIPPETLLFVRLLRKRALILDVRDIWPDALMAYGHPSLAARAFGGYCDFIFRRTLKKADRIMVVAPGFRKWLDRYRAVDPGQVKFVPLGFRREDFRQLATNGQDYDFCYAGGATPQFDIREFADKLRGQKGVVMGSGPLLDAWKAIFPRTEFLGPVPRVDAMAKMSASKSLLFPSNPYAQLPNKAFDYFALGHPVTLGENCTRATRYLLLLRRRRAADGKDRWENYKLIEKEALVNRAANIVEGAIS